MERRGKRDLGERSWSRLRALEPSGERDRARDREMRQKAPWAELRKGKRSRMGPFEDANVQDGGAVKLDKLPSVHRSLVGGSL